VSLGLWIALVTAYPLLLALILCWFQGVYRDDDLEQPPAGLRRSTMRVETYGREVARFEILEHVAPDGEILEFHVPPQETGLDWTADQVAELVAAIDALPQAPELETL